MRTRMYGGVRGRKTKVGGKSTFVFLLLDFWDISKSVSCRQRRKESPFPVAVELAS